MTFLLRKLIFKKESNVKIIKIQQLNSGGFWKMKKDKTHSGHMDTQLFPECPGWPDYQNKKKKVKKVKKEASENDVQDSRFTSDQS